MQLTVKFYIGDEIRRLTLQDNCSYALLRTTLINLCTLPQNFSIKYKDEEGDMISINSDHEFQAAKTLAKEKILRLWICGDLREKKIENVACLKEKVRSSQVIQQLAPLAEAAQQAAEQLLPIAQKAGQQLLPYAQAAQQAVQEQLIPFIQQAAQQLIPLAQQAAQQLIPLAQAAQEAAQEVANKIQQTVQPVKVPDSTLVSELVPSSAQVNFGVESEVDKRWERELNLLKDMGFCQEEDQLVDLLEQCDGQTERVIEVLF